MLLPSEDKSGRYNNYYDENKLLNTQKGEDPIIDSDREEAVYTWSSEVRKLMIYICTKVTS